MPDHIYTPDELTPCMAVHPGEMLHDELEARGLSQRQFAALIGCSPSFLNEIVRGKRNITAETALRIEAATGIKAHIWTDLQADYNMQTALADSALVVLLRKISAAAALL